VQIIATVIAFLLGSLSFTDPVYPPNAVAGGTVIAELRLSEGNVTRVAILSGAEPFTAPCVSALSQWRLPPDVKGNQLAVVHFRQPYLHNISAAEEEISAAKSTPQLPYPKHLVPPLYPPNALAEGGVVLRADISADGHVSNVETIKGMGVLTGASVEALQRWKFVPAQNDNGTKIKSQAYVVFVYRFPLNVPSRR
jgi:TonB family protein